MESFALLGFDPRQALAAFSRSSELVYLPYLLPGLAVIAIARVRAKAPNRLWLTRPATIMRSAWRGVARMTSEPKRAMS